MYQRDKRQREKRKRERKKGERERGLEPNSALHKNVLGALAANAKKICECRHTENHTISNVGLDKSHLTQDISMY